MSQPAVRSPELPTAVRLDICDPGTRQSLLLIHSIPPQLLTISSESHCQPIELQVPAECPQLYVLEPFPQQLLFASSVPFRILSQSNQDQYVRVTVGRKTQNLSVKPSSLTQPFVFPASVCRAPGNSNSSATLHNCNFCMSWGSASWPCSFCFNFTLQTPSFSLHDSYVGWFYP
jgi:hypothetical protein